MTTQPNLTRLSHAEKDTLIAALTARLAVAHEQLAAQDTRIAALEARLEELTRPPKTPGNSSKPPSQGQKLDKPPPARRARVAPAWAGRCIRTPIGSRSEPMLHSAVSAPTGSSAS